MVGLINGDPLDSVTLRDQGMQALESSTGETASAVFRSAFWRNPAIRMSQTLSEMGESAGQVYDPEAGPISIGPAQVPMPATDANTKYGIPGVLQFDQPVTEATAKRLHEDHYAEMVRQSAIERRPDSTWTSAVARFGIGFTAGVLDPINLAAGMMPIVGEARMARMLAGAGGMAGRTAVRAGMGAAQGAAGMTLLQPLEYLEDKHVREDWHMSDALQNIAFGALLGGGLHALGGALHDNPLRSSNPLTRAAEAAGPEARREALMSGIAEHVADGPVTAPAALLDLGTLRSAYADRLASRGETASGDYAAYTPGGMRVELRPQVVEADSLIASHHDTGEINQAYPHAEGMQPRDRSSAASQAQIQEVASRLEPERLGPSPDAATGAPIVNGDNVIESGNGRVMALRRVHSDPALSQQSQAYRAYLAARGHDVEGMLAPVLVGRRTNTLSADELRTFTRDANASPTLQMSTAEQAKADAARVKGAIGAWRPGALGGPDNAPFLSGFMRDMSAAERGQMLLHDGRLSSDGERRISAALLAHAYGDGLGPTLERMLDGDTAHMKSAAGALVDVAGAWGRMRAAAAGGEIPAGLDITPAIGEAVQLLDRARAMKTPIGELLAQSDMIGGPTAAARGLLGLMFRDPAMRQPVARAKLADLLNQYVEQAMRAEAGPGLFGMAETTGADILRAIGGTDARLSAAADGLAESARSFGVRAEDAETSALVDAAAKVAGDAAPAPRADHSNPSPSPEAAARIVTSQEAAAQAEAARVLAAVNAEVSAGRLTEAELAPLRETQTIIAEADAEARAMEAAALCMTRNL